MEDGRTEVSSSSSLSTMRAIDQRRVAFIAFIGIVVGALVTMLALGRFQWFYFDEWDYLASRRATEIGDLLRPHNEHWQTLPIVLYRALWTVFGLRTYLPYQLGVLSLHLTSAVLLRVVMRRAGVHPWLATIAAGAFAFLGSGYENIIWAFQVGFAASLAFGLAHLLLADHDGAFDRRDVLGLLFGLAGLISSGAAVPLTIVVGVATLFRRGWRLALAHTAPLGAVFAVWWLGYGRDGFADTDPSVGGAARFVVTGVAAGFDAIGQVAGSGWAIAVLLVAGLGLGLSRSSRDRRSAIPAIALLGGAVLFFVVSGLGRAGGFGEEFARSSRYLHLFAALTLPAIAVAIDRLRQRWWIIGVVGAVVLVAGIPGNVMALSDHADGNEQLQRQYRKIILTLPRVELAREVPRSVRPEPGLAFPVTIGWLLDGVDDGRIPPPAELEPNIVAANEVRLSFAQTGRDPDVACSDVPLPARMDIDEGDVLHFAGGRLRVVPAGGRAGVLSFVRYDPANGAWLRVVHGPTRVRLLSDNNEAPTTVCLTSA